MCLSPHSGRATQHSLGWALERVGITWWKERSRPWRQATDWVDPQDGLLEPCKRRFLYPPPLPLSPPSFSGLTRQEERPLVGKLETRPAFWVKRSISPPCSLLPASLPVKRPDACIFSHWFQSGDWRGWAGKKNWKLIVCSELKVGAGGREETISCFHSTLGCLSGEKSQGALCRHSVDFLIN